MKFSALIVIVAAGQQTQQVNAFSLGKIGDFFNDAAKTAVNHVAGWTETVGDIASGCSIADPLGCAKHAVGEVTDTLIDHKGDWDELAEEAHDEIIAPHLSPEQLAKSQALIDRMQSAGDDMIQTVGDNLEENIDLTEDIVKDVVLDLADGQINIDATIQKIGDQIEAKFEEVIAELEEDGKQFLDATKEFGEEFALNLEENIDDIIVHAIIDTAIDLGGDYMNLPPEIQVLIQSIADELKVSTTIIVEQMGHAAAGREVNVAELERGKQSLLMALRNLGSNALEDISDIAIDMVGSQVGNILDDSIPVELVKPIIGLLTDVLKEFSDMIQDAIKGIKVTVDNLAPIKGHIEDALKELLQALVQNFGTIVADMGVEAAEVALLSIGVPSAISNMVGNQVKKGVRKVFDGISGNNRKQKIAQVEVKKIEEDLQILESKGTSMELQTEIEQLWEIEKTKLQFDSAEEMEKEHKEFISLAAAHYKVKVEAKASELATKKKEVKSIFTETTKLMEQYRSMTKGDEKALVQQQQQQHAHAHAHAQQMLSESTLSSDQRTQPTKNDDMKYKKIMKLYQEIQAEKKAILDLL
eukprot:Pgem_evm1s19194